MEESKGPKRFKAFYRVRQVSGSKSDQQLKTDRKIEKRIQGIILIIVFLIIIYFLLQNLLFH